MTEREAIFLRHHGLRVCPVLMRGHLTDFNEWMRLVIRRARVKHPRLFTAGGSIRNHDEFTRWLAEAYPAKEVSRV